jgi:hypothetical protein
MMKAKALKDAPASGAKGFPLSILPSREDLQSAIAQNGKCDPQRCWHKVAITGVLHKMGEDNPRVAVDAGHVRFKFKGWRYRCDTPRHVKRSLMLFDRGYYDQVYVRPYKLRAHRTTKVVPISAERQEQINKARDRRIKGGGNEHKRNYPSLRKRVEGFSSVV